MRIAASLTAIIVAGLFAGCAKEPAATVAPQAPVVTDTGNLASLTRGATVIFRTGELTLTAAAACLIDADSETSWVTLPNDVGQYADIELPALTRIRSIGSSNKPMIGTSRAIKTLDFSTSVDGIHYAPLKRLTLETKGSDSTVAVSPVEARFVRISPIDSVSPSPVMAVPMVRVLGDELGARRTLAPDGAWKINVRYDSGIIQRGSRIVGSVGGPHPMIFEGGTDGRYIRFAWARPNEYGLGAMAVNSGGNRLTAVLFHDHTVKGYFFYTTWTGEKSGPLTSLVLPREPAIAHLGRSGSLPLYSLIFAADGSLDVARSSEGLAVVRGILGKRRTTPVRFVAHELRGRDSASNRAITDRQIATLKTELEKSSAAMNAVTFVSAGSEGITEPTNEPIQRELYSRVDLEVAPRH